MAYSGKYGAIYLSSTIPTAFTAEATTANAERTVFQITNAAKRYWDPNTPVVVYADGAEVPSTQYVVAYAGGKVIFKKARGAGVVITVTGAAVTVARFAECHEWKLDVSTDFIDTPAFQADWKHVVEGQTGATGDFAKWLTVEAGTWFLTRLTAKTPLLLLLYQQDTASEHDRFEVMAFLSGDGIKLMTSGAVDEAIDFTVTGPVNYATA